MAELRVSIKKSRLGSIQLHNHNSIQTNTNNMSTHPAVVTVAARAPLEIARVPTIEPTGRQLQIRVEWTASTPLDLHQADGGLLVTHPQVMGSGLAGTVLKTGPDVKYFAAGDAVFGFSFATPEQKAHQTIATVPETTMGKIPSGFTMQEAVTLPNNTVTVFHTVTKDLELPLAWPVPYLVQTPNKHADTPILIWGGASSCGQYALQILRHWGYTNLLTTASTHHHAYLKRIGARHTFDYRDADVVSLVKATAPGLRYVIDCIGSQSGSLAPLAQIVDAKGARVAVLLPVILKDATATDAPEYSMDALASAAWADGVDVRGVRTHFYEDNAFFKETLQSTIVPTLLAAGVVKPNKQKIVEGATLLERAQNALDQLRQKDPSGERLVWRVAEEED
ncbi:zinc-binding dehydrogenase [Ophiostoma piceae UAMH 11346]|uniref:Zinc-binding dehydrogenase n=1 Tax=Ophiostoma piceae (strain UAMH 11346) TaxID=1262450 RepID=S3CJZ0_OPHP1|nr:zinc-binding dehydrogenase [Ophiostoma piceae UAMH 11346]